ncbi:hypothetical protein H9P43_006881 [Blastocladiella emersonii ATCC 22665]|nr:hypothetical protein H9P43_006881 [Blastocladiella emersonii ATCC 22665]
MLSLDMAQSWRANGVQFGAIIVFRFSPPMAPDVFDVFEHAMHACKFHNGPKMAADLARLHPSELQPNIWRAVRIVFALRALTWALRRILFRADALPGTWIDEDVEIRNLKAKHTFTELVLEIREARAPASVWRLKS